ncbi:MAG: hypothetical protein IGS38_13805 [Synechococcales cyanobacterium M58_A2018_015]|nr:hypothetical protein [Synechococcales cyanobacterium M58_A2018_015]
MVQPPSPSPNSSHSEPTSPASRPPLIQRLVGLLRDLIAALVPVVIRGGQWVWTLTMRLLQGLYRGWMAILPKLRARLPEPWQTQLPNWLFTGLAVGLLVLLVGLTTILRSGPTASPTPVTAEPAQPAPELTPDPERIMALQDQLAQISNSYLEGLLLSVEADFRRSQLSVILSDRWYTLTPEQQDQLANGLLRRSKTLEFAKLELIDQDGHLLARNPVVGTNMIVFERVQPPAAA